VADQFVINDQVEIVPLWSIDYQVCSKCGMLIVTLVHFWTESRIEIDPLPAPDGYVLPEFNTGRGRIIPIKHMKNYPELWQPHQVSCLKNSRRE
jgi:hypothetical protein